MTELSWIQPYLAIGPRPTIQSAWPTWIVLQKEGLRLIIDLNDDPTEKRQADRFGLGYKGVKVPDPTEPEDFLVTFPPITQWIEDERKADGRVYLHCTAGMSRSPTCAMAYLMTTGKTREEARNLVRNVHGPAWTSGDIETLERALALWEKQLSRSHRFPDGREAPCF